MSRRRKGSSRERVPLLYGDSSGDALGDGSTSINEVTSTFAELNLDNNGGDGDAGGDNDGDNNGGENRAGGDGVNEDGAENEAGGDGANEGGDVRVLGPFFTLNDMFRASKMVMIEVFEERRFAVETLTTARESLCNRIVCRASLKMDGFAEKFRYRTFIPFEGSGDEPSTAPYRVTINTNLLVMALVSLFLMLALLPVPAEGRAHHGSVLPGGDTGSNSDRMDALRFGAGLVISSMESSGSHASDSFGSSSASGELPASCPAFEIVAANLVVILLGLVGSSGALPCCTKVGTVFISIVAFIAALVFVFVFPLFCLGPASATLRIYIGVLIFTLGGLALSAILTCSCAWLLSKCQRRAKIFFCLGVMFSLATIALLAYFLSQLLAK